MISKSLYIFILSAGIVTFAMPFVRKFLTTIGALDFPNHRSSHKNVVLRGAGLAVFIGFLSTLFFVSDLPKEIFIFLLGAFVITLFGFLDDIFDIPASVKLFGQVLAAAVVVQQGVRIDFISDLLKGGVVDLGFLSAPITIFWIVGVTNAINLIDGLDGLASGISGIAAFIMGIISLLLGDAQMSLLFFALSGAAFAFLPHNFTNKNKVFLGDAGSNFLGYSLAVLSIFGNTKVATIFTLAIPIMVLFIPLFDIFLVIVRRLKSGRSIAEADREHFHHKLVDIIGLDQRQAVYFIYILTLIFGGMALMLAGYSTKVSVVVLGFGLIVFSVFSFFFVFWHQTRKRRKRKTRKKTNKLR